IHYFDLTEDVEVTRAVRAIATGATRAFVPQCGLAPGFISIAAAELIKHFQELRAVKLRVGALPQHPNNVLKYSLTWSTEGLINEYGNPCQAIVDGRTVEVAPLEGLEEIEIDGTLYEAFNTSGGLGSLAETHGTRCESMNYKTIRYPGHCEQMRLLMNDLKLNQDRGTLKHILENAVPQTLQDVIIVYVAVTGTQDGDLREENYVNKIYPQLIAGRLWSAIQVTTAAGITSVVDLVLEHPDRYQGFVAQEEFRLTDILANRLAVTMRRAAPRTSPRRSSSRARPDASGPKRRRQCDERRRVQHQRHPRAAGSRPAQSGRLVRLARLDEQRGRAAPQRPQSRNRHADRASAPRRPAGLRGRHLLRRRNRRGLAGGPRAQAW